MIDVISSRWATWIKTNDPEGPFSYDLLYYALRISINLFSVYFFAAIIGFFTNTLIDSLMAVFSFVALRMVTGGFHLKSLDHCTVFSIVMLTPLPHIAPWIEKDVNLLLNAISLFLVLLLAPTNLKNTRWTEKAKPIFKISSIVLVSLNFYFQSPILTLSFFVQSLLLIPKGR